MREMATQQPSLWPLALYFGLIVLVVGAIVVLSHLVGERRHGPQRDSEYESGMVPTGSARLRFDAQFYLVAIFFIIFDLESVFIFAWAVGFRELGWSGLVEIAIFIGLLLLGLIYIWKRGVLDWRTSAMARMRDRDGDADEV
jgi:NADH-quinone oxidoreductase subunit A